MLWGESPLLWGESPLLWGESPLGEWWENPGGTPALPRRYPGGSTFDLCRQRWLGWAGLGWGGLGWAL